MLLSVPQTLRFPEGDTGGPRCLHKQWAGLTDRNTVLGGGTVFLAWWPGGRVTSQGCLQINGSSEAGQDLAFPMYPERAAGPRGSGGGEPPYSNKCLSQSKLIKAK